MKPKSITIVPSVQSLGSQLDQVEETHAQALRVYRRTSRRVWEKLGPAFYPGQKVRVDLYRFSAYLCAGVVTKVALYSYGWIYWITTKTTNNITFGEESLCPR